MQYPKAILFDLGGTLLTEVRFDREAGRVRVLEIAHNPKGATLADYATVVSESRELWAQRDACFLELPVAAFDQLVSDRLGLTFDMPMREVELEFWKAAVRMEPEPGIVDVLDHLRAKGLPMGVVSNSAFSGNTLSWELRRHGLDVSFKFLMSSADYGVRKPHPMIFLAAAARLGLEPEDIWFIGDTFEADVVGAAGAGMRAIWYNPKQAERVGEASSPITEILHWNELGE